MSNPAKAWEVVQCNITDWYGCRDCGEPFCALGMVTVLQVVLSNARSKYDQVMKGTGKGECAGKAQVDCEPSIINRWHHQRHNWWQ